MYSRKYGSYLIFSDLVCYESFYFKYFVRLDLESIR